MSPATIKTLMTIAAAALGGLPTAFPKLAPFAELFHLASVGLLAWAHGPQPGTADLKAQAKAATDALAKAIGGEK